MVKIVGDISIIPRVKEEYFGISFGYNNNL